MIVPIDPGTVQGVLSQIRGAVSSIRNSTHTSAEVGNATAATDSTDFGSVLRKQLDETNRLQVNAKELSKKYLLGDDTVNLSDVMMANQKSLISTQATVQMRNKLVTAYHDIMQMQI